MIALDTDVLLRLLVDDPDDEQAPGQRERAARLVDAAIARGERLLVTDVALCEVVWAMRRSYGVLRAEIRKTLAALANARHLAFEEPQGVSRAAAAYAAGRGDFADYLIRERARQDGCEAVVTFDRGVLREGGFRAV